MSGGGNSQPVKCLVWDLDNTLWTGTLLEGDRVQLRPGVAALLSTLDRRGILHSIASRNDPAAAMAQLTELGVHEYFVHPQIGWGAKSAAIERVAARLNFATGAIAFVDDQPFELAEVAHVLPQVMCISAGEIEAIAAMPRMNPRFVTDDSRLRRVMYQSDARRDEAEKEFAGASDAFLATLGMVFTIARATADDLQRAEELTVRTHQLNTTGYTYSYDELNAFIASPRHRLLIAGLTDRFGPYGKIGLCLLECDEEAWTIKLLLMSCRVISRGVGTVLLHHVMNLAHEAGVRLRAEFLSTDRNRVMYVTYKFAGFREVYRDGQFSLLENAGDAIRPLPPYLRVDIDDTVAAR